MENPLVGKKLTPNPPLLNRGPSTPEPFAKSYHFDYATSLRHLTRVECFLTTMYTEVLHAAHLAVGQNMSKRRKPLVNIKIAGKWRFIRPSMEPQVMPHGHL